eukprot:CAMPEP_0183331292 /NCGR_PEP_ID=MMETSP0164_2-20130417/664_1 /TAXON_ID=221442 /ORGANISM="Coccolithus pelagicus ssp braarudi, Strain PLY182g" /LENGTH=238 /DNA_ID=CAMNT_0025499727 /DNA_START=120 /DNA_END=836 /DNA_ORIENTATION=+
MATNSQSATIVPSLAMTALAYFLASRYGSVVAKSDLVFPFAFLAYVYIANAVSFGSNRLYLDRLEKANIPFEPMGKHSLGKGLFITETSFLVYFGVFKTLSFLVPLVLIFAGPSDVAAAATPSLLQVIGQAIAELATASYHDVLKILVPIAFQTHRLFGPGAAWALESWTMWDAAIDGQQHVYAFNLGLAWANLAFTAWNLFGFLLLRALPVYFDKEDTPTAEFAYTLLPLPKTTKQM